MKNFRTSVSRDYGYSIFYGNSIQKAKILFHNDISLMGKEPRIKLTLNVASNKLLIQQYDSFYDLSLPLNGADNKRVGRSVCRDRVQFGKHPDL